MSYHLDQLAEVRRERDALRKQVETLARRNEQMSDVLSKIWQACSTGEGPYWVARASLSVHAIQLIRDLADLKEVEAIPSAPPHAHGGVVSTGEGKGCG